jgi:DNA-binding NarL/FixJ family response regulator
VASFLVATDSHDNKLRILIADDHALVRAGVATIVNQEAGMVVIAEAADGETAVALYLQHKPDVALIDLRMPGLDGWEVVRRIKAVDPNANLAFGKTNKEIAERLGITDGTVKVHLANLFQKLNTSTRTEAVATAIRRGLVRL